MATKKEVNEHLEIALGEIGEINPWFDKEVKEWVFSHPLYPVEYGGNSKEEVVANYPKYLREFIKYRLNNRVECFVERKTKGRGGERRGAGRPKGTKRSNTKVVRLDAYIADWVKDHEEEIRGIVSGEKTIVPSGHTSELIESVG